MYNLSWGWGRSWHSHDFMLWMLKPHIMCSSVDLGCINTSWCHPLTISVSREDSMESQSALLWTPLPLIKLKLTLLEQPFMMTSHLRENHQLWNHMEHHSPPRTILKMILKSIYGSCLNEKRKGRNVRLKLGVHRNVCVFSSQMDVLSITYEGVWGLKRVVCNPHVIWHSRSRILKKLW